MNTQEAETPLSQRFQAFEDLLTGMKGYHQKCAQFMIFREGDRSMPHKTPHTRKPPGRFELDSVSLGELTKMFSTERAARLWFEKSV